MEGCSGNLARHLPNRLPVVLFARQFACALAATAAPHAADLAGGGRDDLGCRAAVDASAQTLALRSCKAASDLNIEDAECLLTGSQNRIGEDRLGHTVVDGVSLATDCSIWLR